MHAVGAVVPLAEPAGDADRAPAPPARCGRAPSASARRHPIVATRRCGGARPCGPSRPPPLSGDDAEGAAVGKLHRLRSAAGPAWRPSKVGSRAAERARSVGRGSRRPGQARKHAAGGVEQDAEGRRKTARLAGSDRGEPRHEARRAQHEALRKPHHIGIRGRAPPRRSRSAGARASPPPIRRADPSPAEARRLRARMPAARVSRIEQVAAADERSLPRHEERPLDQRRALGDERRSVCRSKRACSTGMTWRRQDAGIDARSFAGDAFSASASAGSSRGESSAASASAAASRSGTTARPPRNTRRRGRAAACAAASGGASLRAPCAATGRRAVPAPRRQASDAAAPRRAPRWAQPPPTRRAPSARRSRRQAAGRRRSPCSGSTRLRRPRPKAPHVDAVDAGELQEHLHGERALVALDQVQVARRDAELRRPSASGSGQPQPQPPHPRSGEDFRSAMVLRSACDRIYIELAGFCKALQLTTFPARH